MIFPSYIFLLVFLPAVLVGWYALRSLRSRLIMLTLASYVFYGWWDYRFVALMLASTVLDGACGARIFHSDVQTTRKRWLALSIAGNLGLLGFFKYYDFFVTSAAASLTALGMETSPALLNIVLPVGISFYTFQSMSYSIDIYRGDCQPTRGFLTLAAYVSMFPQLVAGPIVRYSHLEQQLHALPDRRTDLDQIGVGVWMFIVGLAKKVWIADMIAPIAEHAFDVDANHQLYTVWIGTLAYTFQLYFDFSAYSDMARGLGKMLGFEFPVNFDSPYKSASISEFWNRWHITLSHWLRDYLFIPLGGSRGRLSMTLRNLGIVMFLGGLWHGADWQFVLWGLFHGSLLMGNAAWRAWGRWRLPRIAGVGVTFMTVVVGWVMFRAGSVSQAFAMLGGMIGLNGVEHWTRASDLLHMTPALSSTWAMVGFVMMPAAAGIAFLAPNSEQLKKSRDPVAAVALALVLLATLTRLMKATPFLYFQF